jgi:hypothetical protein
MRTRKSILVAIALLSIAVAPRIAASATFGAQVYGAFNTYSMKEPNQDIDFWNDNFVGAGLGLRTLDHISSGMTGGLEARVWATPSVMISAGWEPIFAESESQGAVEVDVSGTTRTYFEHLRVNGDANLLGFSAAYFLPSRGKGKFGFGGGLDFVKMKGRLESKATLDRPDSVLVDINGSLTGSGTGFHLAAMGEWSVSPGFGLGALLGYRSVKVSDTKLDDQPFNLISLTTNKTETDYSGIILRVGVLFYLGDGGGK